MPQYLLEVPHTKEECLRALDDLVDNEPDLLKESWFGCMDGDHTEYATISAGSKDEVKRKLPDFLRDKAKIVEVGKITPDQIKQYHQM
jgi:hypothetical protein